MKKTIVIAACALLSTVSAAKGTEKAVSCAGSGGACNREGGRAAWMRGSAGIGVHWTAAADAADGKPLAFAAAVEGFDVEGFADTLERVGAQHVIFTLAHALQMLPMPNAALDRIAPGRTSKRDLFGEILDACSRRGIRVIAYYNHSCNRGDAAAVEWMRQTGCPCHGHPGDMKTFSSNICSIVRDISLRYGKRIDGWWFDSPYSVDTRGPEVFCTGRWAFPWDDLLAAARSGNPDAPVAINSGIGRSYQYSDGTDYYAGEAVELDQTFDPLPDPRLVDTRWITVDDTRWVFSAERGYLPLRFSGKELSGYLREHRSAGRMVTFNVLIDKRGKFSPEILKLRLSGK